MKKLLIAVTLLAFAVPLVVSAGPVYNILDAQQLKEPTMKKLKPLPVNKNTDTLQLEVPITSTIKKMKPLLKPLPGLSLISFVSTLQYDLVIFTWLGDQNLRIMSVLRDEQFQDGKPESYDSNHLLSGIYEPTQDEKATLDSELARETIRVLQMLNKIENILSSFNVGFGTNYDMVVYDEGGNEMNTATNPLDPARVKTCRLGVGHNFLFQLIGKTPQDTLYNQSTHGYFELVLHSDCTLERLSFEPASRVVLYEGITPRIDGLIKLGGQSGLSRLISPTFKALIEDLARRGFPNLPVNP